MVGRPFSRTQWRIAFSLVGLLALAIFISVHSDSTSPQQRDFDSWLVQLEQGQTKQEPLLGPIRLSLQLHLAADSSTRWNLESGSEARNEQILRILQLAREARVFDRKSTASGSSAIEFSVTSGEKAFTAAISEDALQRDTRTKNMLKLFEIYSSQKG